MQEYRIVNTQRRVVRIWFAVFLLMLAAAFSPSFLGIDGMKGGYAISVMAGFVAFTALLVVAIYMQRAKRFDEIAAGTDRIAAWQCDGELWQQFVSADYQAEARAKRSLFFYVSAISAVVGLVMFLLTHEALFLLIIAGLIALLAVVALLAPVLRRNKLKNSGPLVIIGHKGLIVGKMFHYWSHFGARLERVELQDSDHLKILSFTYTHPSRHGRQTEIARVPVPESMLEQALKIIKML